MKYILSLAFLICSLHISAQSLANAGQYEKVISTDQNTLEYHLTLNPNGTFLFKYQKSMDKLDNQLIYAKGTWTNDKGIISLSSADSDIDETHELNLNNSRARAIKKSPRDKSDRIIKDAIFFYQSDISWVKRLTLFKI